MLIIIKIQVVRFADSWQGKPYLLLTKNCQKYVDGILHLISGRKQVDLFLTATEPGWHFWGRSAFLFALTTFAMNSYNRLTDNIWNLYQRIKNNIPLTTSYINMTDQQKRILAAIVIAKRNRQQNLIQQWLLATPSIQKVLIANVLTCSIFLLKDSLGAFAGWYSFGFVRQNFIKNSLNAFAGVLGVSISAKISRGSLNYFKAIIPFVFPFVTSLAFSKAIVYKYN